MYKVGDRVLFTFLGQRKNGEIILKHSTGVFKIKSDGGTIYPFIYDKEPSKTNKGVVNGYIIEKLETTK
jgi:hypothetical protein